ncbi:type II toxin-antitoxin system VapC family toxin [Cyanobium sp. Cruz CV13-4-11]|jgi:toxin FitB|uniref:type II toxin-antitoxin system VapC family toxin n=1 Tax=unclassified Cyanobium TaxID=2627006 RepID=UPI0020CEA442|nr:MULTISPECIES: type II toxin-antitoxin system VapC family toxin [unclassified Cyanobium]MCP9902132.1 type II toxin-antitoxin system VapC family toxin [Cyanobium sp. Cruz CV11-17]MCP9920980.1 type II toxin-antitoxin system VapC family toxin [Cyanobium sp. Cruz CV13-4-11]
MAFLLDTNVVSELRKPRPHGAVLAWLQSTNDADLHLASVTLGEIQAGIEITRDQDPVKAEEIERWLDQLSGSFNLLPMDGAAFRCWAQLMHRRSDTLYEDAMIAAIARVHDLTVVTRNGVDFLEFGVALFNPFEQR